MMELSVGAAATDTVKVWFPLVPPAVVTLTFHAPTVAPPVSVRVQVALLSSRAEQLLKDAPDPPPLVMLAVKPPP